MRYIPSTVTLVAGTLTLFAASAVAQAPVAPPVPAPATLVETPGPAPETVSEATAPAADPALEAYVDGMVQAAMKTERIAGVGVTVVRDGRVILLKGYGQANANGRRVDPDHTLFRIASISKTFTWIALILAGCRSFSS